MNTYVMTEEMRLNAILHLEGMPAELALDVDRPEYLDLQAEQETELSAHEQIEAALNLDSATPVDTFIDAQAEHEYRWKDDAKEVAQ